MNADDLLCARHGFGPGDKGTAVRSAVKRLLWSESSPYAGNSQIRAHPGFRDGVHSSPENGTGVRAGPPLLKDNGGHLNCSGHLALTRFSGVCRERGNVQERGR